MAAASKLANLFNLLLPNFTAQIIMAFEHWWSNRGGGLVASAQLLR
jgi:hypothetical protein